MRVGVKEHVFIAHLDRYIVSARQRAPQTLMASSNRNGRGMLPIGSVGKGMLVVVPLAQARLYLFIVRL
jgi:hypothetical protein